MPDVSRNRVNRQTITIAEIGNDRPRPRRGRQWIRHKSQQPRATTSRPEDSVAINQSPIAARPKIELRSRHRQARHPAEFFMVKITQSPDPHIIKSVNRHRPGPGSRDPRIGDNRFILCGRHSAITIDSSGIAPR